MNDRPADSKTTEPAGRIIEAVAQLQAVFLDAGLREPIAIVLAGEEQKLRLENLFSLWLAHPIGKPPWDAPTIRGMKVLCNVPG